MIFFIENLLKKLTNINQSYETCEKEGGMSSKLSYLCHATICATFIAIVYWWFTFQILKNTLLVNSSIFVFGSQIGFKRYWQLWRGSKWNAYLDLQDATSLMGYISYYFSYKFQG